MWPRKNVTGRFTNWETSAKPENKKPSDPGKTANEGIERILMKNSSSSWPHPSLDGEAAPLNGARREQADRYPDLGFKPHSRLPDP